MWDYCIYLIYLTCYFKYLQLTIAWKTLAKKAMKISARISIHISAFNSIYN
jgi:hypothetical protein